MMKYKTIMKIVAGSGGENSQEVAYTVMRMYLRWIEKSKYTAIITSIKQLRPNAIRSVSLVTNVPHVLLAEETGSHRFTRVNRGKIHTSFVGVGVLPIYESTKMVVPESELRYESMLSSGKGGQNAQKNQTAIRITHTPTKIKAVVESSRSQHENKRLAKEILLSRLILEEKRKEDIKLQEAINNFDRPQFGFRTRTYSYRSPKQVINHIRKIKTPKLQAVLDGDLGLINPSLMIGEEHSA